VQRLEDKNGQLKVDLLADWKPMELPKDWSDVVTPPGFGHQSRDARCMELCTGMTAAMSSNILVPSPPQHRRVAESSAWLCGPHELTAGFHY